MMPQLPPKTSSSCGGKPRTASKLRIPTGLRAQKRKKNVGLMSFWGFVQPLMGFLVIFLSSWVGSSCLVEMLGIVPRSPCSPLGSRLLWDPPWLSGTDQDPHQTPSAPD